MTGKWRTVDVSAGYLVPDDNGACCTIALEDSEDGERSQFSVWLPPTYGRAVARGFSRNVYSVGEMWWEKYLGDVVTGEVAFRVDEVRVYDAAGRLVQWTRRPCRCPPCACACMPLPEPALCSDGVYR